jgi:hypothetical protein
VNRAVNVFANYSYQAEPEPDFDKSEINLPPTNRFNAGFNFSQGHYLGNFSVGYVDDAYSRMSSTLALPVRPRRTRKSTVHSA